MGSFSKRLLALFLAVLMMFGAVPVQAFATDDGHDHSVTDHMTGEDDATEPEETTAATAANDENQPQKDEPTTEPVTTEAETVVPGNGETGKKGNGDTSVTENVTEPVTEPATEPEETEPAEDPIEMIQELIDENIDYYLVYYGFEIPDLEYKPEDEMSEEEIQEWQEVFAQIEDIVLNKMDANERENAYMAVREVEYILEEQKLTEKQLLALEKDNLVFCLYSYLLDVHATNIDYLSSVNVSNGIVTFTDDDNNITYASNVVTATANANKRNNLTIKNNSSYPVDISFTYVISGIGSFDSASFNGESKGNGTYTYSGTLAAGTTISAQVVNIGLSGSTVIKFQNIVVNGTVTFAAGENGTYTVNDTAAPVTKTDACGTSYTLVATPAAGGYQFVGWYVNGAADPVSTNTTYTFTNQGNMSIAPKFEIPSIETTFQGAQGNGTYTVNGAAVAAGTTSMDASYSLVATPNSIASRFVHWYNGTTGTVLSTEASYSYVPTASAEIYPVFEDLTSYHFSITHDAAMGSIGTVGVLDGKVFADTPVKLTASPVSGGSFVAWTDANNKIVSTANPYEIADPTADVALKAFFTSPNSAALFKVDGYLYDDLNAATAAGTKIVLAADGVLPAGDYNIPSGDTLLIPMSSAETVLTTAPNEIKNGEPSPYTTPSAYRTLTMAQGANITVEGAISVAGSQLAGGRPVGGVSGPVGFIKMVSGSKITVKNGANLYVWGYITGSGEVEILSGGTVYESFQVMDWRGGNSTSQFAQEDSNPNKIFPLSQYYVQNVEVPMKLNAGANETGYVCTTITVIGVQSSPIPFIGTSNCMFKITDGYMIKDYDETQDRQIFEIHGNVAMDNIHISMQLGLFGSVSIDSRDYVLPITNNLTVDVVSGNIDITQNLCFLPGSEIIVRQGATCNLADGKSVYVYDVDEWGPYCAAEGLPFIVLSHAPGRTFNRTSLSDAKIKIGGTINADAGFLYTTNGGASVTGLGNGTGKVNMKAGTATVTYQATQDGDGKPIPHEIPIVVAKLQNADGTTTDPAKEINPAQGTTYTYIDGKWVPSCNGGTCVSDTAEADVTCQNPMLCKYCGAVMMKKDHTPGAAATCTTAQTCTVCGTELKPMLGHSEETIPGTAATCTDPGMTEGKKCNRCGETLVAQTEIGALGHNPGEPVITNKVEATCTEDGSYYETIYCTRCQDGKFVISAENKTIPATGHAKVETVTKNPDCDEDGVKVISCSKCSEYSETVVLPMLGHTPGEEATCTTPQICTVCSAVLVQATGHTAVPVAGKEATCTETGLTDGEKCSVCGVVTVEQTEIPAKGHTAGAAVEENRVEPGCETVGGFDTVVRCSVCGTQISSAHTELPAAGHGWGSVSYQWSDDNASCTASRTCSKDNSHVETETVQAVVTTTEPSCTQTGLTVYNAEFTNAAFSKQSKSVTLSALNHDWSKASYTWADDKSQCTASRNCQRSNCTASETETVNAVVNTIAPTCDDAGKTEYTATFSNTAFEQQKAEVTIEAKGHAYGTAAYVWATDMSSCTATRVCANDGTHVLTETKEVSAETTDATCTVDGKTVYSAAFSAEFGGTQTKSETIKAPGHKTGEAEQVVTKEATCKENGSYDLVTKCTVCGNELSRIENQVIEKLQHVFETYQYNNDAKCGVDGTETAACARGCGETDTRTSANTALEHSYTNYVSNGDAKCEVDGTKTATCDHGCGTKDTVTDEGSALEHRYSNYVSNGDAKCEVDGTKTATCDNGCGTEDTVTDEGSALSHSFTNYQSNGDATCTADGTKTAKCDHGCGKEDTIADAGSKLQHKYDEYKANGDATCTDNGTETAECAYGCGATDTRDAVTGALGHSFTNYQSNGDATCTVDGTKTAACDRGCGEEETVADVGSALGHQNETLEAVAATCTSTGWTEGSWCPRCGIIHIAQNPTDKIPHVYESKVTTEPNCEEDGVRTYTCKYGCGDSYTEVIAALGHSYEAVVTAPGCLTDGYTTHTCKNCGDSYQDTPTGATGHTYDGGVETLAATCVADGVMTYTCINGCGDSYTEVINATGHKYNDGVVKTEAKCEVPGEMLYTCTVCDENTEGHTKIEEIAALEHRWFYEDKVDATCTQPGNAGAAYCPKCGKEVEGAVIPATGHKWEGTITKNSTCLEEGELSQICTVCGATQTTTLEKADHISELVEAKAATCTEAGHIKHYICKVCGNLFADNACTNALTENDVIVPVEKHSGSKIFGQAAGCLTDGWKDYWQCGACNAYFSDENCKNAIADLDSWKVTEGQGFIKAKGHTVVVDKAVEATCTKDGLTEGSHCSVCSETIVAQETVGALGHNDTSAITTAATCEAPGVETFTCGRCGRKETKPIQATGHAYGNIQYLWNGDHSVCTASAVCGHDAKHTLKVTGNASSKVEKAATCTEDGLKVYTATFDNDVFETQTFHETLNMLGHSFTAYEANGDAKCGQDGTKTAKCDNGCGTEDTVTDEGSALSHSFTSYQSNDDATCTADGTKTAKCDHGCGAEDTVTDVGSKIPHSFTAYEADGNATCTDNGTETAECDYGCGATDTRDAASGALGHEMKHTEPKAPSCTEDGTYGYYQCQRTGCGLVFEDAEGTIATTVEKRIHKSEGHKYEDDVIAPTCKVQGYTLHTCSVCGDNYKDTYVSATGHTAVTDARVEPTCTEEGKTEGSHCSVCNDVIVKQEPIAANGHSGKLVAGKAAACEADGWKDYWQCEACEKFFSDEKCESGIADLDAWKVTEGQGLIEETGHTVVVDKAVAPTCTATGKTEGSHCSVCNETIVAQDPVDALGHTDGEMVKEHVVPATCTADGSHEEVVYCTVCNAEVSRVSVVDKTTGHAYTSHVKAPTCTEDGFTTYTCSVCQDSYTDSIVGATGHTEETLDAVAPTCTETGLNEGKKCTVCGVTTMVQTVVPSLGHTVVVDNAVAPTCTETGLTAGQHCSACGEVLLKQEIVPSKGHAVVVDKAVAPTCTATGKTEGSHCSVCNETIVAQETVDALGHEEETVAGYAATCTATGMTDGKKCTVCGVVTVQQTVIPVLGHTVVVDEAKAATCTETGLTEGKHCSVCGEVLIAQREISAKGHTVVVDAAVAATCTTEGKTEGKHCSVCNETIVAQETVDALGHTVVIDDAVAPTCLKPGLTEGKHCSVCDEILVAQEDVAQLEHSWDEGRITTQPTCTETGVRTFTCATCNGTMTETEKELGHDVVYHEGKKPTYTSAGYEPYETCNRCEDYNTMVAIPALGEPEIENFDEFIENLEILEGIADTYVKKVAPGKDPAMLVIKYIRTGVDRYNSGSWNIMAGYEDAQFAEYVTKYEEAYNADLATGAEMMKVSGLKNIHEFYLPNGDFADIGHVFGSMDITYTNKGSQNHADVSGWAGDTVDMMSMADQLGLNSTELEEMIEEIKSKYFLKYREDFAEEIIEGTFSQTDMEGDLDAVYVMQKLYGTEYKNGTLTDIFSSYMTPALTNEQRAKFFLDNRLDGASLRTDVRDAVYNEYVANSVVTTLEGSRHFATADITSLRKACCYVFADYLCRLAGDFVEFEENDKFTVFQTETSNLAPGIVQKINYAHTADGKTMVYYLATGDITRGDVQVYANYNNNDPGAGWAMQRVIDQANVAQKKYGDPESPNYIENYNVIASINGAGYDMYTGEPSGILVMNGTTYHPISQNGFFAILDDGTARIGTMEEFKALQAERYGRVQEAIATFGDLIRDGKIIAAETSDRASRTAVGITASGKVVFMVLDGRQGDLSCGGTMREIAQIMLEAGCVTAVNLDGGGSSTYVAKEAGDTELSVVSKPSDGISRSVSTSLMMVSTAPSSTKFDHAVIESEYAYFTVNSSDTFTATAVSATGNVLDMPEGVQWAVSNENIGTITADGVFTAKALGTTQVQLMLDGTVIGSKTIHVVIPDNVYFEKQVMNAIYGEPIELPTRAAYEGKAVAANEADFVLSVEEEIHGTIDGNTFTGNEESGLRKIQVTVALACDPTITGTMVLSMYTKDEASFDFEGATGGDRQLAWIREVTNATLEGTNTYRAIELDEDMVTSYTFAMDMSQIEMPNQLKDLVYMLPGADVEGNNSAWSFLLQLAERVSVLTEVTPVLYFDKNLDVDYSNLSINNEYFYLKEAVFNEEENSLALIMKWHRQVKPIEPATANPLCILTGIELTPKDDAAWNSNDALPLVNKGSIGYDIYLRANALYSFSSKPENQEIYGLYPFTNVREDGVIENGGHFQSVYKEFEDQYTLINAVKDGWVVEGGGFAYYENGEKYVGICQVDGYYYDFGDNGVNIGQKKYTGEMTGADGKEYYVVDGLLYTGWMVKDMKDVRYYNPETGVRENLVQDETPSTCIIDGYCIYTSESGAVKRIDYDDAGGHEYVEQADGSHVCSLCGHVRIEMEDAIVTLDYYVCTYTGKGRTPATTAVSADGRELKKPGQSDYPDYYSTYKNNLDVGTATVTLTAARYGKYSNLNTWRGNAAGSITVEYEIRPDLPTDVILTMGEENAVISWNAALTPDVTYVVYSSEDGDAWTEVGETMDLSYSMDLVGAAGKMFRIGTRKIVDGKAYESVKFSDILSVPTLEPIVTTGHNLEGKPTLAWTKVAGAVQYKVYRCATETGKYANVFTTKGRTYTHASATAGNSYFYFVRAMLEDGSYIDSKKVTNDCITPAEPFAITIGNNAEGKPTLKWTAVNDVDHYEIYRSTAEDGTYAKVFTTTGKTYTHVSATAGRTYYYKVKIIYTNGTYEFSYVVSNYCRIPEVKFVITTGNNAEGKPTLLWAAIPGADRYEVYRSTTRLGTYQNVFGTKGTTYTHISATAGRTYYYKLKVYLKDGSEKISSVYVNSCQIPAVVFDITTGHNDAGKPTLQWTAIPGADHYEVYRSGAADGDYVMAFTTKGTTYTNASATAGRTYYYKLKVYLVDGTEHTSHVLTNVCLDVTG